MQIYSVSLEISYLIKHINQYGFNKKAVSHCISQIINGIVFNHDVKVFYVPWSFRDLVHIKVIGFLVSYKYGAQLHFAKYFVCSTLN